MAVSNSINVVISGTAKSLQAAAKAAQSSIQGLRDSVKNSGIGKVLSTIGSGAVTAFKKVGTAALGAATAVTGAVAGIIAKGGWDRAMSIEQASFKLQGLGHDADSVSSIMDDALKSVKGTAYGLGDAATVAASAVAAGVKPGEDLERTLKLVGDAAAISGREYTEMGSIFNKVAAAGKLTGEEINQLTDSGIPILSLLADQMHVSADEVRDLVSAGKVGFPEFQAAIEAGMGGAALTMGQTFSGALANTKAALSRLGVNIMQPLLDGLTPALGQIISIVDDIAAGTTDEIDKKTDELGNMLSSTLTNFIDSLAPVLERIIPVVISLLGTIAKMLPGLIQKLLPVIATAFTQIVVGIVNLIPSLVDAIVAAVPLIVDAGVQLLNGLIEAMPIVIPALLNGIIQIVIALATALTEPSTLSTILQAALTLLLEIVKAIPQMITALIDALPAIIENIITFLTDPATIGMIFEAAVQLFFALVTAVPQILGSLVGALGSIFESAWNAITGIFSGAGEWFGNIFQGAWDGIKNIFSAVGGFFSGIWNTITSIFSVVKDWFRNMFQGAVDNIKNVFSVIGGFFSNIWNGIKNVFSGTINFFKNIFQGAWNAITGIFSNLANFFGNIFSNAWNAVKNVFSTGGRIFAGIVEGIGNLFRNIVNAIIGGINKVVAIPFNAINGFLDTLRGINILGITPFGWIGSIGVPQIPTLATGGIIPGSNYSGDRVLARVNSGEMVMNGSQQQMLWDAIQNGEFGGGSSTNVTVNIGERAVVVESAGGGDDIDTDAVAVKMAKSIKKVLENQGLPVDIKYAGVLR